MTRRRRAALVGAGVLAALLGVAAWLLLRTPSERPFWDYVAELKAKGEPTTLVEFVGTEPADAENAAPEIDAALTDVENELGPAWKWPTGFLTENRLFESRRPDLTSAQADALADFADALKPFADRVAAAMRRPRCRFRVVFDANGLFDAKQWDRPERAALLLVARARFARNPDARLDACLSLARFAARLEEPTGYRSAVVATGAACGCATAVRDGAAEGIWDAKAARRRLDEALTSSWMSRAPRTLRCGAVGTLVEYGAVLAGTLPSDRTRLGLGTYARESAKRIVDRVSGQRFTRDLGPGHAEEIVAESRLDSAAAELPTDTASRWQEAYHAASKEQGLFGRVEPHRWCDFVRSLAAADDRARLARLALALAEFRADHGIFPASLDELSVLFPGGVPVDAVANAPYAYERVADGVRAWRRSQFEPDKPLTFDEAASYGLGWELKR